MSILISALFSTNRAFNNCFDRSRMLLTCQAESFPEFYETGENMTLEYFIHHSQGQRFACALEKVKQTCCIYFSSSQRFQVSLTYTG